MANSRRSKHNRAKHVDRCDKIISNVLRDAKALRGPQENAEAINMVSPFPSENTQEQIKSIVKNHLTSIGKHGVSMAWIDLLLVHYPPYPYDRMWKTYPVADCL
ncbi:hypothetical protein TNCV_1799821 [Trichonephila clavipes]|nr:hypothetical protein TNCV_1799821 [Trichonephila clavipes]